MTQAVSGPHSFYLVDFSDEVVPCEPTLEGWAQWLAEPDLDSYVWCGDAEFPIDGSRYKASAILWSDDIVARKKDGQWSLSRSVAEGEGFFALRHHQGSGWDADNIIAGQFESEEPDATLLRELIELLGDGPEIEDAEEYIAVGRTENNWLVTFHEGPPAHCSALRPH